MHDPNELPLADAADADDDADEEDLPDAFEAPDTPERALPVTTGEFAAELAVDEETANACIRCGNSCRSVYLWQGDLAEFKERDTKKWTEYHEVETFTKEMPDGKTFWGIKLPKPCKHLITADDGLSACAIYDRRPYVCRIYTGINPDGPQPGCGYGPPVGPTHG
jgi:Fe-S-cluster containining protein